MPDDVVTVDPRSLQRSAERIARDIEALSSAPYTSSEHGITRHAYTPEYRSTLGYFTDAFTALGFEVHTDPVGTLVASNRPAGAPCIGLGSHCDANRNGGPWDGTLGVVAALEVARMAQDRGIDLPLRVFAFLEEEGSGFGSSLLGSRITLGDVTPDELAGLRDDRGVPFLQAAAEAGHDPDRLAEAGRELDGLVAWMELHIEQGRVLQERGLEVGIVHAIAGYVHGDVTIVGRADHAGGTPMEHHCDPLVTASEVVVRTEELAPRIGADVVGTVGELSLSPGLINVIPGEVTFSLDLRSASGGHLRLLDELLAFGRERAESRRQPLVYRERVRVAPTPMAEVVLDALRAGADELGIPTLEMVSGAAHDTMLVARRIPSAMVFVPCREGISHSPDEHAEPAHAARGCELLLAAARRLMEQAA